MSQEEPDWDAVEEEHREETEHDDRAHEKGTTFSDVVREQYRRLDEGDLGKTVSAYDEHTAALLAALEESGDLERVLDALEGELGTDFDGQATKSKFLVAASRLAIASVDEDLLDQARDAYRAQQDDPF